MNDAPCRRCGALGNSTLAGGLGNADDERLQTISDTLAKYIAERDGSGTGTPEL